MEIDPTGLRYDCTTWPLWLCDVRESGTGSGHKLGDWLNFASLLDQTAQQ